MSRMIAGVDYEKVQRQFLALLESHVAKDEIAEVADCMEHCEGRIGIVIAAQYLVDAKVKIPVDLLEDYRILAEQIGDSYAGDMDVYDKLKAL